MPFSISHFLSKCISSWISWGLWGIISLNIFWLLEHFVVPVLSSPTPLYPHHALLCCPTFSFFAGIVSIITLTRLAYECYICMTHVRVIHFPQAWRSIPCIWLSSIMWSGASLLGWNNHILDMHGPGCTGDWPSKDTSHSSFVLFLFLGCLMVSLLIVKAIFSFPFKMWVEDFEHPSLKLFWVDSFPQKRIILSPHSWCSSQGLPAWLNFAWWVTIWKKIHEEFTLSTSLSKPEKGSKSVLDRPNQWQPSKLYVLTHF